MSARVEPILRSEREQSVGSLTGRSPLEGGLLSAASRDVADSSPRIDASSATLEMLFSQSATPPSEGIDLRFDETGLPPVNDFKDWKRSPLSASVDISPTFGEMDQLESPFLFPAWQRQFEVSEDTKVLYLAARRGSDRAFPLGEHSASDIVPFEVTRVSNRRFVGCDVGASAIQLAVLNCGRIVSSVGTLLHWRCALAYTPVPRATGRSGQRW